MLADISSFRTSFHSQEQLLLELDMYQDIAVARGSTYDTLNKRMDRCQENIETVSDDIQRLQGGLIGIQLTRISKQPFIDFLGSNHLN